MANLADHITFPHPGHLNGSGAQTRADEIREALSSIRQLRAAIGQAAPHPRDWQGADNMDGFREAREIHRARIRALEDLETALTMEAMQWMEAAD